MGYKLTWRQGIGYMYQPGSQCMGTEHLAEPTLITWLLVVPIANPRENKCFPGRGGLQCHACSSLARLMNDRLFPQHSSVQLVGGARKLFFDQ